MFATFKKFWVSRWNALAGRAGLAMSGMIMALVVALVGILIALILAPIIIGATVTAATTATIGSFAGVQSLLGLVPLLFTIAPVALSIGVGIYFFGKFKGKG
jgi:putative exporter of polyketide antibiotics